MLLVFLARTFVIRFLIMTKELELIQLHTRIDGIEATLKDLITPRQPKYRQSIELIDTSELCKRLSVTEPTVIAWRNSRKIPFIKIGGVVRFDWAGILLYLQNNGGANNG
jgi:excisionase family DNA binding protein